MSGSSLPHQYKHIFCITFLPRDFTSLADQINKQDTFKIKVVGSSAEDLNGQLVSLKKLVAHSSPPTPGHGSVGTLVAQSAYAVTARDCLSVTCILVGTTYEQQQK